MLKYLFATINYELAVYHFLIWILESVYRANGFPL